MEQATQIESVSEARGRFAYLTDKESFLGTIFLAPAVIYIIVLAG